MGADILEYVDQKVRDSASSSTEWSILYADDWAKLRAEIVRLRGEVDSAAAEECQAHREAHMRLDTIVMGAGVFELSHEGGITEAWQNTIEAVSRLIAPAEAKGDWFALPMLAHSPVPDDYRNQASGYRAGWNDALRAGNTPHPADGGAVAWVEVGQFCLGRPEEWGLRGSQLEAEDQPLYTHPPAAQDASMRDWSLRMADAEAGQTVTAGAHGIPDEPASQVQKAPPGYRLQPIVEFDAMCAAQRNCSCATLPAGDALGAVTPEWVVGYMPAQITHSQAWPQAYVNGYNDAAKMSVDQVGFAFAEWAALQHRGDSRGGEG